MSDTSGVPPASQPSAPSQASSQPPASSSAAQTSAQPNPEPSEQPSSSAPPPASSSPSPAPAPSSSNPPSSSAAAPTSSAPQETSSEAQPSTLSTQTSASAPDSSSAPDPSSAPEPSTSFSTTLTVRPSDSSNTEIVVVTSTSFPPSSSTSTNTQSTGVPLSDSSNGGNKGLDTGATVAIGVVVPIVAIAILAIAGLFFWKKRRARMQAEEERRKEVEDYSYNPNADPTIPSVAMMSDNGYEMREDGSSGYRGWGNTVAGSTGRKASTTISASVPYSDATSPTYANASEARSGEPLMDSPYSGEGEILGAMGPSAANNRGGDVHRGPSNASSSYSAAGRSDGSDGPVGMAYGSGAGYYDSYNQNPYTDNPYGGSRPQEAPAAPVIRDNPARRNTRIESPSHFPQGSVGISQNF